MACIKAAVTDHFEVLFRDMADEAANKFHSRDGFLYIGAIFVPVVMECDIFPVIVIDTGGGNHRPAKAAPNVFDNFFRVTFVWFCIDIKTMFIVTIAQSLCFFEGWAEFTLHFIKESSTEGIAQESVVKIVHIFPETAVTQSAFGQQAVDMGVPF